MQYHLKMNVKSRNGAEEDTREKLLAAARLQFAERGFHGASISLIAGEVGLTKQALLYHFKRKDDLYTEVIRGIAERLLAATRSVHDPESTPEQQFEDTILGLYASARANPLDAKLLVREVLDDQRRDAPPEQWFHRKWLDEIVARLGVVEGQEGLSTAQKIVRVYQIVSAVQLFVASKSVLERFYGEDGYADIAGAYPDELRMIVRRILNEAN